MVDPLAMRHPARVLSRLERIVLGGDAVRGLPSDPELDRARIDRLAERISREHGMAALGDALARGCGLQEAQVAAVRELAAVGQRYAGRSLSVGLREVPGGHDMDRICTGLLWLPMRQYHDVWNQFARVDVARLAALAPVEAVTAALAVDTEESRGVAERIALEYRDGHRVTILLALAGRFLAVGATGLGQRLVEAAQGRDDADFEERDRLVLEHLRRWTGPRRSPGVPPGAVPFGVLDYHQPDLDRSSGTVEDYTQTLAVLANLARFQSVRFSGSDELGELARELQERVRPELRIEGSPSRVHLLPVSRDFSEGDDIPEGTWMLAFGWHMQPMFQLRYGFPYHPSVNPIFVSVHVGRIGMLTPEALDYLRQHAPIGCRDWATVDLLMAAGVDAFFTGCVSSTVDAVFPDLPGTTRKRDVVGVVDVPEPAVRDVEGTKEHVTHGADRHAQLDIVTGTRSALERLETYRHRFDQVVTSRLHAYLPATSLGIPVRFRPPSKGDGRFDGLLGMAPEGPRFVEMRDGIRSLIAEIFALVAAGEDREIVRRRWREVTAPMVAEARERLQQPPSTPPAALDIEGVLARIRQQTHAYGPHDHVDEEVVTEVALSLDANFRALLPVTVESIVTHASGPVRLWITERGLDEGYREWFHRAFPDIPVTFLGFDHVDYGQITRMFPHISIATMDRLFLPEALPQIDRITYIDIDTVTEGDVCELAAVDLQGHAVAGRPGHQVAGQVWRAAGNALPADKASDLRRTMAARGRTGYRHLNCGVMVLDLARMRADRFVAEFVPMAGTFGLNDQDIINAYAGPRYLELDPRWNAFPAFEDITVPGIVHYAGAGKPWGEQLVPEGDRWRRTAARLHARVGEVPAPLPHDPQPVGVTAGR